ncbi:MAG: ROK family protein [Cyclobacteriaceae bacterium]|nr:ROK family protein [Cyclobacteriaceae bacterium]
MIKVTIGIDIGGTGTKFGLVDVDGNVLFQGAISTQTHEKFNDYISELANEVKKGIDPEKHQLIGIGAGAPNGNIYRGTIEDAPNLRWRGILPLAKSLEDIFNVPTVVTNDANAAAVGEMIFGGAKNMKDFIVITLGTGLGGGIVTNGQLVNGYDGFAGELGHLSIHHGQGRFCGCGKRGCLETYVSATGIKRTVYKLLADYLEDSELRGISFHNLSTKMITEVANRGDIIAKKAFEYTGRILGTKLADTVHHTNPEAIFIFGGLSLAGDLIFKPTIEHLEKNLMSFYKGKVKILPSSLQNQSAPIIGASSLVWDKLMKEKDQLFV